MVRLYFAHLLTKAGMGCAFPHLPISAKAREKTMEIAMEDWGVPAFFLAKNGQLAA